MQLNHTVQAFLNHFPYEQESQIENYHHLYPEVFETYFNGYCRKTDDKMTAAMDKYLDDLERIKAISRLMPGTIEDIKEITETYFGFPIDVPVHLFVGLYATNAFVDHRSHIYFALEQLTPDPGLLKVVTAHEFIHSYHYHILEKAGIEWSAVDWRSGCPSIYLEGVATFLSRKLVPGHHESVYYSYNRQGEDWLSFCKSHRSEIARILLRDLQQVSPSIDKEWLKMSGGSFFGFNRLGYFLGTEFVSNLFDQMTEVEMLHLLAGGDLKNKMMEWLRMTSG